MVDDPRSTTDLQMVENNKIKEVYPTTELLVVWSLALLSSGIKRGRCQLLLSLL